MRVVAGIAQAMRHSMTRHERQQVEVRRTQFFAFFRKRLETARRQNGLPYVDRMVLLTAGLDALAKHWGDSSGAAETQHLDRMRIFLARHGGHGAFERVSVPLMHADKKTEEHNKAKLIQHFPFERYCFNGEVRPYRLSSWSDDAILEEVKRATSIADRQLARFSYGGILYCRLRNSWVHELLQNDEDVLAPDESVVSDEPHYRFVANGPRFVLVFPVSFLEATYERCIESFARDAEERQALPFRE